jgi:hypothetical protein
MNNIKENNAKNNFFTQNVTVILFIITIVFGGVKYIINEKDNDLSKLMSQQNNDHELLLETRDEVHELKTLINFRLDHLEKRIDK